MTKREAEATALQPENLYPLPVFKRISRIGDSTIRRARNRGVELPAIRVGRCKFVEGSSGIAYIRRLAELGN